MWAAVAVVSAEPEPASTQCPTRSAAHYQLTCELGDLFPRLHMAAYWNSPGLVDDPAYPEDVIAATGPEGEDGLSMDDRALAFVVRGLLDLTGRRFDPAGRLLPVRIPVFGSDAE
jgi:hypothetical protein